MIVVFRADASLAIGSGHVMRCLALADALAARGHRCVFLSHELEGHGFDEVRARGHEAVTLTGGGEPYGPGEEGPPHTDWLACGWREDAAATRAALEELDAVLLVVDHYGLDARWQQAASPDGPFEIS